jgi:hypothetical protein
MVQSDDGFNKKPKRVVGYCNQTGKYLPIKLWRMNKIAVFGSRKKLS